MLLLEYCAAEAVFFAEPDEKNNRRSLNDIRPGHLHKLDFISDGRYQGLNESRLDITPSDIGSYGTNKDVMGVSQTVLMSYVDGNMGRRLPTICYWFVESKSMRQW